MNWVWRQVPTLTMQFDDSRDFPRFDKRSGTFDVGVVKDFSLVDIPLLNQPTFFIPEAKTRRDFLHRLYNLFW